MLNLLAQASDANGWNITTSIAAAAGLISLATLIVTTVSTTRREDRKWARDTLSQAFYELVDASYQFSDALAGFQHAIWGDDAALQSRRHVEVEDAELRYRKTHSKVRLLAGQASLDAAEDLRTLFYAAREAAGRDVTNETYKKHADAISAARGRVTKEAKKAMSLPM